MIAMVALKKKKRSTKRGRAIADTLASLKLAKEAAAGGKPLVADKVTKVR